MVKSSRRTSMKNIGKSIFSSSKRALPAVNSGLKRVGTAAKDVAIKSVPIVEKGVSVVYGTMAKGFDLGVKGARGISKTITKKRGGKRRRRHSRRR